jgi:hypothetical protein
VAEVEEEQPLVLEVVAEHVERQTMSMRSLVA